MKAANYKVTVTARVEVKTKRALLRTARQQDMTPSALMSRLLEDYIAKKQLEKSVGAAGVQ